MDITAPATDVHNPNKRNNPTPAAIMCGVKVCIEAPFMSWIQRAISAAATISRRSRSPWLGRRSANVEDTLRITIKVMTWQNREQTRKGFFKDNLEWLELDDPAFNADYCRLGAVTGA